MDDVCVNTHFCLKVCICILIYSYILTDIDTYTFVHTYTVNVDIFTCIHFLGFMEVGNFACIKIRVLSIIGPLGYYKSDFRGEHNFADI